MPTGNPQWGGEVEGEGGRWRGGGEVEGRGGGGGGVLSEEPDLASGKPIWKTLPSAASVLK